MAALLRAGDGPWRPAQERGVCGSRVASRGRREDPGRGLAARGRPADVPGKCVHPLSALCDALFSPAAVSFTNYVLSPFRAAPGERQEPAARAAGPHRGAEGGAEALAGQAGPAAAVGDAPLVAEKRGRQASLPTRLGSGSLQAARRGAARAAGRAAARGGPSQGGVSGHQNHSRGAAGEGGGVQRASDEPT